MTAADTASAASVCATVLAFVAFVHHGRPVLSALLSLGALACGLVAIAVVGR